METKEYIICSAVHYQNGVTYKEQPVNIISGLVVAGRRHNNCVYTLCDVLGFTDLKNVKLVCGFITNTDRFVDRKDGYIIALEANQIKPREEDKDLDKYFDLKPEDSYILISEDLY